MRAAWLLLLLLPALAAALNPLGLPERRPASCDPSTCAGCGPYLPPAVTEISDSNAVPDLLCGTDDVYFPVSIQYGCSADDLLYPVRWLCQACCTAGCPGSSFDYYCATYDYQAEETVGCGGCPAGLDLGRVPVDVLGFAANCTRPHWDQNFYNVCYSPESPESPEGEAVPYPHPHRRTLMQVSP